MLGFTYNGKHCEKNLHVKYVPKESERGDLMDDYDVLDQDRSWNPGGYYYKARPKARTFTLPCFYEDLTRKQREDIVKWLDRRGSGWLIFDERPWARYYVHPTKKVEFKDYSFGGNEERRYSGTFSITLTAYYPFAELIGTTEESAPFGADAEVDLLKDAEMPSGSIGTKTEFVLYNPGTEATNTEITFVGSTGSDDLVITNVTTGDVCVLKAGLTATSAAPYVLNSKTGRVTRGGVLDFSYHDKGYIQLAPNEILRDNIAVGTTSGSRTISSNSAFLPEFMGAYIYVGNAWKYLGTFNTARSMDMNVNASSTGTERTKIASMNYFTIQKANNASITKFEIAYIPEVR